MHRLIPFLAFFVAAICLSSPLGVEAVPFSSQSGADEIEEVYLVSSCHLDVGFADSITNILNRYLDHFLIDAANTAKQLREEDENNNNNNNKNGNGGERLVFMVQSYVMWIFDNCEKLDKSLGLHCPNATTRATVRAAFAGGDLSLNAFPHNSEVESMNRAIFASGLQLTRKLAQNLGMKEGDFPKTFSQRDVPGLTRSAIPVLVENGIEAVSVGVNTASLPPAVPNPFIWRDDESMTQVIAMWHPFGYGGIERKDCVIVPGFNKALALGWKGDNDGPPSVEEVKKNFAQLRKEFPKAKIIAATFDDCVTQLKKIQDRLPVVRGEIGDTWIHGYASDPLKLATHRILQRIHARESKRINNNNNNDEEQEKMDAFAHLILKNPEHTWGMDVKTFLGDETNWTNANFEKVRFSAPNFLTIVDSWKEQREYGIDLPLKFLGNDSHPLVHEIRSEIARLRPEKPENLKNLGFEINSEASSGEIVECGGWKLQFNRGGAVVHLSSSSPSSTSSPSPSPPSSSWASPSAPLGRFVYQTLDSEDYSLFFNDYAQRIDGQIPDYFPRDFGKPGMETANPRHLVVDSEMIAIWEKKREGGKCVALVVEMVLPKEFVENAGAPEVVHVHYRFENGNNGGNAIDVELDLFNKTATRLPEALWFQFNTPLAQKSSSSSSAEENNKNEKKEKMGWQMQKMGELVSPLSVVVNGSRHLHCIDEFVQFSIENENNNEKSIGKVEEKTVKAGEDSILVNPRLHHSHHMKAAPHSHQPHHHHHHHNNNKSKSTLTIFSTDAALISFGGLDPFPTPRSEPDVSEGFAFCLFNNIWGTNFVMWYPFVEEDKNLAFRFRLEMSESE